MDGIAHVAGEELKAAPMPGLRPRLARFAVWTLSWTVLFLPAWIGLVGFSVHHSLYSHLLLMPCLAVYLAWSNRPAWDQGWQTRSGGAMAMAALLLAFSVAALWIQFAGDWPARPQDRLCLLMVGYGLAILSGLLLFFGGRLLSALTLPALVLLMTAPFPLAVEAWAERFFQYTSAEAAAGLFTLSGTALFREGLVFNLPGITLEVAQECSGIRSSLVLFITSLAAGDLFLRSPGRRLLLAFFVVPLAIVRNGLRIFTIGLVCIHISPEMIHSWVHRRGGPLFFGLSLIPFFALLFWLRRSEERREAAMMSAGSPGNADPRSRSDEPLL